MAQPGSASKQSQPSATLPQVTPSPITSAALPATPAATAAKPESSKAHSKTLTLPDLLDKLSAFLSPPKQKTELKANATVGLSATTLTAAKNLSNQTFFEKGKEKLTDLKEKIEEKATTIRRK